MRRSALQGFPDGWCSGLGTEDPTDEDIAFWSDVFETHRKICQTSSKPKSKRQIVKWLKDPHSDSAEYKMWGNGVALPCVFFVLSGIVWVNEKWPAKMSLRFEYIRKINFNDTLKRWNNNDHIKVDVSFCMVVFMFKHKSIWDYFFFVIFPETGSLLRGSYLVLYILHLNFSKDSSMSSKMPWYVLVMV